MEDNKKVELLNTFIASVFTAKTVSWEFQSLEMRKSLGNGMLLLN